MISKERLEELINQKSIVYDVFYGEVELIDLTMIRVFGRADRTLAFEYYNDTFCQTIIRNNNDVYETQEEAEWQLEFGNIARTETLNLPTWEEFQKQDNIFKFIDKQGYKCKIGGYYNPAIGGFIDVVQGGTGLTDLDEYSKENYVKACRLAKKLFLGDV